MFGTVVKQYFKDLRPYRWNQFVHKGFSRWLELKYIDSNWLLINHTIDILFL